MQQQRQTLSVCIRFHDGAHLRSASTVRVLRFPPPLTLWLILDFSAFKIPSLVSPHFLVSMIPHGNLAESRHPRPKDVLFKVGLGILQITSQKRCPQAWPWFGRSLFSTNFCAEIFMNETNMRRFESVFNNQIFWSWHQKSKRSKRIVLIDNAS